MPDLKNITIIGLGLIGSSIARAVKKNLPEIKISAFSNSLQTTDKAKNIGIIDYGFNNVEEAVKISDMVILCSPLGTYDALMEKIAPNLKNSAIISDAGSVKGGIIKVISKYLNDEQLPFFIPAHPIAGSEKSGIDAGSDDLYENKQLIITPLASSNKQAVETVEKFWKKLGSNVVYMDAFEHDKIYAATSHLPHLISFCYANMLSKLDADSFDSIKKQNNPEFKGFIRLAGSNAAMWRDIFLLNQNAISQMINEYYQLPQITENSASDICRRINNAAEKRKEIRSDKNFYPTEYTKENFAVMDFIPKIIACLTIESVSDYSHVGGGFLGLTRNILSPEITSEEKTLQSIGAINKYLESLSSEIRHISEKIHSNQPLEIEGYINNSLKIYENLN